MSFWRPSHTRGAWPFKGSCTRAVKARMARRSARTKPKRNRSQQPPRPPEVDIATRADQLYRAGRYAEAQVAVKQVLKEQPELAGAHTMLGIIELELKNYDSAAVHLGRALELDPENPDYHHNWGLYEECTQHYPGAVEAYRRAYALQPGYIRARKSEIIVLDQLREHENSRERSKELLKYDPNDINALFSLGLSSGRNGDRTEAKRYWHRLLEIDPSHRRTRLNLALIYVQEKDWDSAELHFRRVIAERDSDDLAVDAAYSLGTSYSEQGKNDEAIELYDWVIARRPDHVKAHYNRALAFQDSDETLEAYEAYERLLAIDPANVPGLYNLGHLYQCDEAYATAIGFYRQALDLDPEHVAAGINLALCYDSLDRFEEALPLHRELLEKYPENAKVLVNYAFTQVALGDTEAALELLDRAIEIEPDFAKARFNRSLFYLSTGRLAEGWDEYHWRFDYDPKRSRPREFDVPQWEGEPLEEKTLLIWREQGIGDEVLHASCYQEMIDRAGRVIIECEPRLLGAFTRSFPKAHVRAAPNTREEAAERRKQRPDYDLHIPGTSLAKFLRRRAEDFPQADGYVLADPDRRAQWREWLDSLGEGPKVGISWRSGLYTPLRERQHYYTRLDYWGPVFAVDGVQYVNLLYGDVDEELCKAEGDFGVTIHRPPAIDLKRDIEGVLALSKELDVVISAQSSNIDFAAAVGTQVFAFLPPLSQYRLAAGPGKSRWYRGVRIFERARTEPWDRTMRETAAAVAALVPSARPTLATL